MISGVSKNTVHVIPIWFRLNLLSFWHLAYCPCVFFCLLRWRLWAKLDFFQDMQLLRLSCFEVMPSAKLRLCQQKMLGRHFRWGFRDHLQQTREGNGILSWRKGVLQKFKCWGPLLSGKPNIATEFNGIDGVYSGENTAEKHLMITYCNHVWMESYSLHRNIKILKEFLRIFFWWYQQYWCT